MKVIIIILGSRGTMGHFNVANVLAEELMGDDKKNSVTIVSDDDFSSLIKDKRIGFRKIPSQEIRGGRGFILDNEFAGSLWPIIKDIAPDFVLFETFVPRDVSMIKFPKKTKVAILSSANLETNIKIFLRSGFEEYFDSVLVLDDAGRENKSLILAANKLVGKEKFVSFGPLIKSAQKNGGSVIRKKYGLDGKKSLLVTLGGGGYKSGEEKDESEEMIPIFVGIAKDLGKIIPNFKMIILSGYFSNFKTRDVFKNITLERYETDFISLLGEIDMIICRGGPNTLNEVLAAGIPAIVIPAHRNADDQEGRAIRFSKISGNMKYLKKISRRDIVAEAVRIMKKKSPRKNMDKKIFRQACGPGNDEIIDFIRKSIG